MKATKPIRISKPIQNKKICQVADNLIRAIRVIDDSKDAAEVLAAGNGPVQWPLTDMVF